MRRKRTTRIDIKFGSRSESIEFFRQFGFVNIAAALEEAERQDAAKAPQIDQASLFDAKPDNTEAA